MSRAQREKSPSRDTKTFERGGVRYARCLCDHEKLFLSNDGATPRTCPRCSKYIDQSMFRPNDRRIQLLEERRIRELTADESTEIRSLTEIVDATTPPREQIDEETQRLIRKLQDT